LCGRSEILSLCFRFIPRLNTGSEFKVYLDSFLHRLRDRDLRRRRRRRMMVVMMLKKKKKKKEMQEENQSIRNEGIVYPLDSPQWCM
jgi:hypothetical protein